MSPELQVRIQRLGNHYVAVTTCPDGQEILRNEFQHETTHTTHLGPLWLIDQDSLVADGKRRRSGIPKGESGPAQLAAQGSRLFRYLFGDGSVLGSYIAQHPDQASHQLTLVFTPEAAHLARQPWEYLFDGEHFPCLTGKLLLSRRPSGAAAIDTAPPTDSPLRILAVVPAPTDQVAFDALAELGILQTSLEQWLARGILEMDILPEPTSGALLERTGEEPYHIIHYVGHATYRLPQHQGFLCFEDELGQTELLSGTQLPRFLKGKSPGLLTLAACQKSQVGLLDAFQSVATELMDHEIPGVLTVPVTLSASTATALYRTLYGGIAQGGTVQESLHRTRAAVQQADRETESSQQRFEWGVPALIQKAADLRLIRSPSQESTQNETLEIDAVINPLPTLPLVGRTREIQVIRKALREEASIFYILGGDGVGKQVFTSYVIERLAARRGAVLTIRCREELDPLTTLAKIADFWRTSLPEADPQAADLLLDAHQAPFQRAQRAQQLLAQKRYLLVFENLDTWFGTPPEGQARLQNDTLRQALLGLLREPSKALFFFTGGRRWEDLASIAAGRRREIRLPLLSLQHAIQVINQLPALRQAVSSSAEKRAVYAQLGGHPQALQVLDRWLILGNDLQSLGDYGPTEARSPETWVDILVADILTQMDPGEYGVLQALSFLVQPFTEQTVSGLTLVAAQHALPLIQSWLCFGLAEPAAPDDARQRFRIADPVRRVVLDGLSDDEFKALHLQAARYYAAPYYDAARRQLLARSITSWAEDRIGWLARDASGILGIRLRQEQTTEGKARLVASAYAWQYHLMQAGDITAATQIIQTIAPVLNQLGQRDLSREILQAMLSANDSGPSTGNEVESFVRLKLEEGPLSTALTVYEDVYVSLDPDEGGIQRAYVLLRAGNVKQRLSDPTAAIEKYRQALRIAREEEDREAEAACMYRLATAHREDLNLRQALVCSQAAKEHYEALGYPNNLAIVEREQGLVLEQMERPESALERFAASLQICRQLGDRRCIADNLTDIGRLFEKMGNTEMAIQVIEEALQHYEYLGKPEHGKVLSLLEELYAHKRRIDEAVTRLRDSKRGE